MNPHKVLGALLFVGALGLTVGIASAIPPGGTDPEHCKQGDFKINGICYASCGTNNIAQDRRYCLGSCPTASYRAGTGNLCVECQQQIKPVSVVGVCGSGPCNACQTWNGGLVYYCPLWEKTNWCCVFPPTEPSQPQYNSHNAKFGSWHRINTPDYANGVAGPAIYERCASWPVTLILRHTYLPSVHP